MSSELIELSQYRMAKAKEDLANSIADMENGFIKGSINRSYYAVFHAIRSVNALAGFDSKKHSGVIAYFNQHYIYAGVFSKTLSDIIKNLSRIRNQSDYDDFFVVGRNEAEMQLAQAKIFVAAVETYLQPLWNAKNN